MVTGLILSFVAYDMDTTAGRIGAIVSVALGLLTAATSQLSVLINEAIRRSNESELTYVSKTLGTTIKNLESKLNKANGSAQDKIEKQIRDAESFKNKVDTQIEMIKSERTDDTNRAIRNT